MKSICVFCGSNVGDNPGYAKVARQLGAEIARRKIGLVTGGGHIGLMGVVADAALAAGGEVIGVIPEALQARELAHRTLTKLHVVPSMHARKALMAELSEGFIALPGGFGTFEEFCEVLTWAQLGLHSKPCGILNVLGYYDSLLQMFNHAAKEQFLPPQHRSLVLEGDTPSELLEKMSHYKPIAVPKWLHKEES